METFIPHDERDANSILVLAGDISSNIEQLAIFLHLCAARFSQVFCISGNHEYYGHVMQKWELKLRERINGIMNLKHSYNDVCYEELENVRFIWGTLWGDGGHSLVEQAKVGRGLRDFYVISVDESSKNNPPRRFTVPDMVYIHKKHKADIKKYLAQPFDGVTVVATHHMPSYRLCHPRFGTEINGGFASNCDDILAYDDAPDVWIHGHTHDTGDGVMWKTRIVCNPSGYHFENDERYKQFKPVFIDLEAPKKPTHAGPAYAEINRPEINLDELREIIEGKTY